MTFLRWLFLQPKKFPVTDSNSRCTRTTSPRSGRFESAELVKLNAL
jgi:hypothetical protein